MFKILATAKRPVMTETSHCFSLSLSYFFQKIVKCKTSDLNLQLCTYLHLLKYIKQTKLHTGQDLRKQYNNIQFDVTGVSCLICVLWSPSRHWDLADNLAHCHPPAGVTCCVSSPQGAPRITPWVTLAPPSPTPD